MRNVNAQRDTKIYAAGFTVQEFDVRSRETGKSVNESTDHHLKILIIVQGGRTLNQDCVMFSECCSVKYNALSISFNTRSHHFRANSVLYCGFQLRLQNKQSFSNKGGCDTVLTQQTTVG